MIVTVDASVAADWFLPGQGSSRAAAYLAPEYELVAPDLILIEVGNVLLKSFRRKEITAEEAQNILRVLLPAVLRIVPAAGYTSRAFDVAHRFGGSIYDAIYVCMAQSLDAPIVTRDRQMASVAERLNVRTLTVGDSPPSPGS